MKERDVVLMSIAQADGQKKPRPVLFIQLNDTDFPNSGLVKPSVVRLSFLAIVRRADVMGQLGTISRDRYQRLLSNLANYLQA